MTDFRERNVVVFGISTDSVEESASLAKGLGLDFSLLSDPERSAISAFGLRHEQGNPMQGTDIARPAVFLVDETGHITWSELTDNWRVRLRPERVLDVLDETAGALR